MPSSKGCSRQDVGGINPVPLGARRNLGDDPQPRD